jgi:hypothetical protein
MKSSRRAASRNIRRPVEFLAARNGIPAAYTNRSDRRKLRRFEEWRAVRKGKAAKVAAAHKWR